MGHILSGADHGVHQKCCLSGTPAPDKSSDLQTLSKGVSYRSLFFFISFFFFFFLFLFRALTHEPGTSGHSAVEKKLHVELICGWFLVFREPNKNQQVSTPSTRAIKSESASSNSPRTHLQDGTDQVETNEPVGIAFLRFMASIFDTTSLTYQTTTAHMISLLVKQITDKDEPADAYTDAWKL